MNIKDFNIGDMVLCVDYTRRNDPVFLNAVIDSIGRKYVRCNVRGSYHKFGEVSGTYSEHYLVSSKDMFLYLFKNKSSYDDYIEHMELNSKLHELPCKSLTLNQLRRIRLIAESNDNNVLADKAETTSAAINMLGIGRTQSVALTDEDKNKVFVYALEALYRQLPKKPKESDNDEAVCCPACGSVIHRYDSTHSECSVPFCKWCGQLLNWQEFDSEGVSDEVKNTD